MCEVIIENEQLKVGIHLFGAELSSVYSKEFHTEYMYHPDGIHWNKQSPILFPNIGFYMNDSFYYKGEEYPARKHGFARDYPFRLESKQKESATFIQTNEDIEENYPFEFELRLQYRLVENRLLMTYSVKTKNEEMYFAIGGHPAFNVPLEENLTFEDYRIHLESNRNIEQLAMDMPYLVSLNGPTVVKNDFSLHHDLFKNDVLLFKSNQSKIIGKLYSKKGKRAVTVELDNMNALGVWTNPDDSPFVCLEPWDGYPDVRDAYDKNIENKVNVLKITANEPYESTATFIFE